VPNFAFDLAPPLLGSQLPRVAGQYVARMAIQPRVRHDFNASRTKEVQFPRFRRWGERSWTKAARRRNKTSLIGTANSEGLSTTIFKMQIFENTGPSTVAGDPSTLWITKEDILFARAQLMEYGIAGFHESIGSQNLSDDYNGYLDRVHILETMNTSVKINPANKADASTLVTDKVTSSDLDRVLFQLQLRNTPVFADGFYHALMDLVMVYQLMSDTDFKQSAFALMGNAQVPVASNQGMSLMPSMIQSALSGSTAPMGRPDQTMSLTPIRPLVYKNLLIFPSNNIPKRTVNSLEASLATIFGPDTVAFGSGGKGVGVEIHSDTDFNRHFRYIWSHFFDVIYTLDDDNNSGCAVELRTFGTV
jgi:hypothetical protein